MPEMKRYYAVLALLGTALMQNCSDVGSPKFELNGTLKGQEGKMIYIEKFENNKSVKLDSALIGKDGSFSFKTPLPHTDFYQVVVEPNNAFVFIADPDGEMTIEAEKALNTPKKIEGSEDTKLMMGFEKEFNGYMARRDSMYSSLVGSGKTQLEAIEEIKKYDNTILASVHNFIDKNSSSPASLLALSKLNPITDIKYFEKVEKGIAPRMRTSMYYLFLQNQIMEAQQQAMTMETEKIEQAKSDKLVPIGGEAPEISMADPMGQIRSLSELRGKVVLIDFWASWCPPCRQENPNVVKAYKQFKDKGFEVFSVSLDKNAEAWKNAIMTDNLTWTHVSDLQHWNSAAAKRYGITGIPATVLVDKNGKVIAKNLHGEQLVEKLKQILG